MNFETHPSILRARLWGRVDEVGECWEWQGARRDHGYGHLQVDGRWVGAHRLAYELTIGPIPDGLVLDHLCRNPPCVRPDHLEAVRQRENLARGNTVVASALTRTHCPNGHPRTPANTVMDQGKRRCIPCRQVQNRRTTARRRAERIAA